MPTYVVNTALLPVFTYSLGHYPDGIPSRFEKISSLIESYCKIYPDLSSNNLATTKVRNIFIA